MSKIRPVGNRVVVEYDKSEETTDTGIIIPENAKEAPQTGKVIGVGEKVKEISEGDTVLFSQYSGSEVALDGATYKVLNDLDIFAVLE